MMNDLIYLEPDDEITAVIDRLRAISGRFVVLVVPKGCTLAQSVVNLKILKRNASANDKEIALVATDRVVRNLASQVGITTYSKVSEVERRVSAPIPIRPTRQPAEVEDVGGLKVHSYDKEESDIKDLSERAAELPLDEVGDESKTETEPPLIEETRVEPPQEVDMPVMTKTIINQRPKVIENNRPGGDNKMNRRHFSNSRRPALFLGALLILACLVIAVLFLPYAEAAVELKTAVLLREETVTVDRNALAVDDVTATLPGRELKSEQTLTKSYNATGSKDVGEKAKGKMTVLNSYDTSPHKFAKGTKFTTSGKIFVADEEFTAPAAQTTLVGGKVGVVPGETTVNVTADKPGAAYNIAAANYVIDGAPAQITGKGGEMKGGVTKEVKVVLEKDIKDAETDIAATIAGEGEKAVQSEAEKDSYIVINGSFASVVSKLTHSKKVDDEADNFETTVNSATTGLGFKESDLRNVLNKRMEQTLSTNQMLVNPDKSTITYEILEFQAEKGILKVKASITGRVGQKMAATEIQEMIKNQSVASIEKTLEEKQGISSVKLQIWPAKFGRTPLITSRIKVKFDYED